MKYASSVAHFRDDIDQPEVTIQERLRRSIARSRKQHGDPIIGPRSLVGDPIGWNSGHTFTMAGHYVANWPLGDFQAAFRGGGCE